MDCNDEQKLREDPVIRKVLDSGLCFQPTLSRFENKADRSLIYQMSQWFVDRYVEELKEKTGQIIIDVDGTSAISSDGAIILPVLRPGNCGLWPY